MSGIGTNTLIVLLNALICVVLSEEQEPIKGVDVSEFVSEASWRCLKEENYTKAIIRLYRSNGLLTEKVSEIIQGALAANMKVEIYMWPYTQTTNQALRENPRGQVQQVLKFLKDNKFTTNIQRIWIDVENEAYWDRDKKWNQNFLRDVIKELIAQSYYPIGIYSNAENWKQIMGDMNEFSSLPLWYARYKSGPNFEDFVSFGGWTKPVMKQYQKDVTSKKCKVKFDPDWQPEPLPECIQGPRKGSIVNDISIECREYVFAEYEWAKRGIFTGMQSNKVHDRWRECCNEPCGSNRSMRFNCGVVFTGEGTSQTQHCTKCIYEEETATFFLWASGSDLYRAKCTCTVK